MQAATAPALELRAGVDLSACIADQLGKGAFIMSFTSWLRKRKTTGRSRPAARFRPQFESLETRTVLSVAQPNIVFIMTDDQDVTTMQYMPKVKALLADQGVTFNNSFVTSSICCPSHVTSLTGQYNFNHGVLNNALPTGGFQKFVDMRTDGDLATQGDESTLAVWLDEAGYNTARVGKYLVGYPDRSTYVPPGWDEWYNSYEGFTSYFGYRLNENGTVVQYGSKVEDYITDVFTAKAVDFINRAEANDDQPFFLTFTPTAPHSGVDRNGAPNPAPRHVGMFAGVKAPRTPSFNEADVSDKPPPIRNFPLLTSAQIAAIDREYQARIESLQALDEGIGQIIDILAARGELEHTYIIFTSDNGYHLGQHRFLNGKFEVYEEDIRVPLVIRGPGVQAGTTRDQMVVNIDLAPTMARWGSATPDRLMDGQSLTPLLGAGGATQNWRTDFLVELYRHLPPMQNGDVIKALRTEHEVYVEYQSGPRELYDLRSDPDQLQNVYATADPGHIADLSARLAELATSQGNPPFLPGDFNLDGSVDAADYVRWRFEVSQTMVAQLTADSNGDGIVDDADYQIWRRNFGRTTGNLVQQSDSQNASGAVAESVAPLRELRLPALDRETAARDQAFSTLAPPRGLGQERRSRFAPFGREHSAQLTLLNNKDLLAVSLEGNSRAGRDFLRSWLPPSMPVSEDGDGKPCRVALLTMQVSPIWTTGSASAKGVIDNAYA
jgi:arylsulfatase A-like enzyme